MDGFGHLIEDNPFKTRKDVVDGLKAICNPLRNRFREEKSFIHMGNTGAHYGEKWARMEAFSRLLWGLGPLWVHEDEDIFLNKYLKGLVNGTNPRSTGYWGDLRDYSQLMVEMAAIAVTLSITPHRIWQVLKPDEQQQIYGWLNQINQYKIYENNWTFFRILVNTCFKTLGLQYNDELLRSDLSVIEKQYIGSGWYMDGNQGQLDYYIPFAMHFYGLIYAKLAGDTIGAEFINRAKEFAMDYCYWFAKDGSEIPFGRSLTYRFAHSSFFAGLAFADVEALPWGVIKGIVLGNLRSWFQKPILDTDGILTIGYHYPNLFMSEKYNSPGSPYWALKTFLILALEESHPFWQAEEVELVLPSRQLLEKPRMLMIREDENQHVFAYVAGQHCMDHGNSPAKYEKFVYSNCFGFSVSRGESLSDGGFDNTLAVSLAGDEHYRMKYGNIDYHITKEYTYHKYQIMSGVIIQTYIVPFGQWHIRIHHIHNKVPIDIADGGFSIPIQLDYQITSGSGDNKYGKEDIIRLSGGIIADFPWGRSGIIGKETEGKYELIHSAPNTNLMSPLTAIPTYCRQLEAGKHVIVNSFIGERQGKKNTPILPPTVRLEGQEAVIEFNHGTYRIHLEQALGE